MTHNLIRLAADTPICRVFRRKYIGELLVDKKLRLVPPSDWGDPFEDMLTRCGIVYLNETPHRQVFFDSVRRPIRAQCWSVEPESDAIWQIYSRFDKDPVSTKNRAAEDEGIQIRTTASKLLQALWDNSPANPSEGCFLGAVHYMQENQLEQHIADEIGKMELLAFGDGPGHAESVLFKRPPFFHEQEARLIYVGSRDVPTPNPFLLPVEPIDLIEEIVLDPRLGTDEEREREAELRGMGYHGPIRKSRLYQKKLWLINIR
jgi:hypothetical protein